MKTTCRREYNRYCCRFLDDVDYLEEIITYVIYAPWHDHLVLVCISIALRASRTPLMSMYASYRLAGERGGTRGVEGDRGAGTFGRTRAGRRAAEVSEPQA